MHKRLKLPPLDPLRRYTIDDACLYLGFGKPSLYRLINADPPQIKTIQERKRRFVPGSEIARLSSVQSAA